MTFEELLARDGSLTYKTRGTSMEPLLHENRDLVTIRKKQPGERCRENDVVLYRYPGSSKYILHRIVEVRPEDYVILGDNCTRYEYGIRDENILGSMICILRDGREVRTTDETYLAYVRKLRANEKSRIRKHEKSEQFKQGVKKLIFYDHWKKYIGR